MRNYFRVQMPRKIDVFLLLTKNIIEQHESDGAASALSGLDMAEMKALYIKAKDYHERFEKLSRDKEAAFQDRNQALGIDSNQYSYTENTVLFFICSIRDYLLGIHKSSEQLLGNWSYDVSMSNGFVSVNIPRRAVDLLALGNQIYSKHQTDGAASPLNEFDMVQFGTLLSNANAFELEAKQLTRNKETNYQLRNNALGFGNGKRDSRSKTLLYYVTAVRNVLLGIHKSREKHLGQWGFEVDDSPRRRKAEPNVNLSGTVQDANTQLSIKNAKVVLKTSLGDLETTTDDLGNFEFELSLSQAETALITVDASSYSRYVKQIGLMLGENERVVVEMGGG
jgi:hypothetical protein